MTDPNVKLKTFFSVLVRLNYIVLTIGLEQNAHNEVEKIYNSEYSQRMYYRIINQETANGKTTHMYDEDINRN